MSCLPCSVSCSSDAFKNAMKLGTFPAILVTYTTSALLHVSNAAHFSPSTMQCISLKLICFHLNMGTHEAHDMWETVLFPNTHVDHLYLSVITGPSRAYENCFFRYWRIYCHCFNLISCLFSSGSKLSPWSCPALFGLHHICWTWYEEHMGLYSQWKLNHERS